MKSRNFWTGIAAAAGMVILILDSQTAIGGIREGIDLCLKTLIPSLFPFFILSALMTGSLIGSNLKILRPVGRLCGIPEGAESLLLTGLLGGYPVGAQSIAQACESGALSREDAQRMIGFCNNAGPAFLFGIIAQAFSSRWTPWLLWAIHIASALIVGAVSAGPCACASVMRSPSPLSLTDALKKALSVMAQVCGWVILFRMALAYLERWFLWILPPSAQILTAGMLELSNGCVRLKILEAEGLRFTAAAFLLALGGLCVTLQTSSVTGRLSLRYYFPGKLLQASLSVLMALCLQGCFPSGQRMVQCLPIFAVSCTVSMITVCFLRKKQKNSSIPLTVGV